MFYTAYGEYKHSWLLEEDATRQSDDFFAQAGKRNKKAETEFLEIAISSFADAARKNKDYFDKNQKVYMVSSIATVLIIAITIV